jgi:peptide chain release factor 1
LKLETMKSRLSEISEKMSDPKVISNQNQFQQLSKEYSKLSTIVNLYNNLCNINNSLTESELLLQESDQEMKDLAQEEIAELTITKAQVIKDIHVALIPEDPDDHRNIFLEIRAGTGGDEAALFAGDLYRMYARYAESKKWQIEIVSMHEGDHGGFKEVIIKIIGQDVYSHLKFESGGHRVQRVPDTESQGRIHTSACTVAVMPEADTIESVDISPSDLKIDTFRASGAGGQHVNTTDSAVRITHIPTGVVSECQDERSQHKNKAKAMSLLQAKILNKQKEEQQKEQSQTRRLLVGSGDRSERIRTYNFPQGRVTDHRINLTLYKLPEIIAGDMSEVVAKLQQEHQADLLTQINE